MSWVPAPVLSYITAFSEPPIFDSPEQIRDLLLEMVEQGGSDIYFQSGYPVLIKLHGAFKQLTERRLQTDEVLMIIDFVAGNGTASGNIAKGDEFKCAYSAKHPTRKDARGENKSYRFRANAIGGEYNGGTGAQLVMRSIRSDPPLIEELGLDQAIIDASTPEDGAIYIVGATGSGKSTTFAGLLRRILVEDTPIQGNIVTLEDPIEYVYDAVKSNHSVVFQSEIGRGIKSFNQGIISLMRHDPSLIVVGETRDQATSSAVISAAITGHLVYTTLHANDTSTVFSRMLSFYEPEVRNTMLFSLVDTARLLISQRLVPSLDGKRVPLREYLVLTKEMRQEIIDTSEPSRITGVMRGFLNKHGLSMAQAAERAFEQGLISETVMNLNKG